MRLLRLIEAAVQVEILRVSAQAQRTGMRVLWAAIALVFASGAIACAHVAAMARMTESMSLAQASLIMMLFDLVIAGLLAAVAMRNRPTLAEREALVLRRQIWAGLERDLGMVGIAGTIATTVFDMVRKK